MKIANRKSSSVNPAGFTLIELLVVISIIGLLAGMSFPVIKSVKAAQQKRVARGELEVIQTALENYKAKYGTYPPGNQNPNNAYSSQGMDRSQFSQLYYELSGTTNDGAYYITLDGSSKIASASVNTAYGVGGFINSDDVRKSGEDAKMAKNFLVGLNSRQIAAISNKTVLTLGLITSVGGPDLTYQPLGASDLNPIRYQYPGVHNPNSYDLWIQLRIGGKTNLICNWSRQVSINSPLP